MTSISWTDTLQAVSSLASVIVAIVGFAILIHQVRQLERGIRSGTDDILYNQSLEIMMFLTQNSEIRPYFYDGKIVEKEDPNYGKLLSFSEMLASFLELVALQKSNIPPRVWLKWVNYIKDMYSNSPILRQHIEDNQKWYSEDILNILR